MNSKEVKEICKMYDFFEFLAVTKAREKSGLGASYGWDNTNILEEGLEICLSDYNDDDHFIVVTYEELAKEYAPEIGVYLLGKDLNKDWFKAEYSFLNFRETVGELQKQGKVSDFRHWVESNGEESNIYGSVTVEGIYHEFTWYMYSNEIEIKVEVK